MKNGPYLMHILNEFGAEHMHHLLFLCGNWLCNLKELTKTQCLHVLYCSVFVCCGAMDELTVFLKVC